MGEINLIHSEKDFYSGSRCQVLRHLPCSALVFWKTCFEEIGYESRLHIIQFHLLYGLARKISLFHKSGARSNSTYCEGSIPKG